jgi:AraC-like DNA-binding protein
MNYQEFAPTAPLRAIVDCLWTLESGPDDRFHDVQPVLPDGRPELILHFADPFERVSDAGAAVRQPAVIFAGQLRSQLLLRPTGRVSVLGIRFRPDGAAAIVGLPQHLLAGQTLPVSDLLPSIGRALEEIRTSGATSSEAAASIQALLVAHVAGHALDWQVRFVVDSMRRRPGLVSVDRLAAQAGLSRRQLERRFTDKVGISPKRLARVIRFQHALRVLDQAPSPNRGTITAIECGFSDQAHFIRDFRDLAGCAPGVHLLRDAEMTGFFVKGS